MSISVPSSDTPLTALCAICHINFPKYVCPRCSIHTCSLSCVQKHKKRAQCSGVRNPAKYVSRKDLATEQGVDRDFNFLSGLERGVGRALEQVEGVGKGSGVKIAGLGDRLGKPKFAGLLEKLADERGVKLVRAPPGLSRRRENKSRVIKKDASEDMVSWTIEWFDTLGKRRIQNFDETMIWADAYGLCHPKRAIGKKRKRTSQTQGGPKRQHFPTQNERDETAVTTHLEHVHDLAREQEELLGNPQDPRESNIEPPEEAKPTPDEDVDVNNGSSAQDHEQHIPLNLHFYLHRPQTSSKLKCLIPISPTDAIKDTLNGKRIVEYPTVYIRNEAADELSQPFILEKVYLEQHGEDLVVPQIPPEEPPNPPDTPSGETVEASKVLEVLKQDLVSVS